MSAKLPAVAPEASIAVRATVNLLMATIVSEMGRYNESTSPRDESSRLGEKMVTWGGIDCQLYLIFNQAMQRWSAASSGLTRRRLN